MPATFAIMLLLAALVMPFAGSALEDPYARPDRETMRAQLLQSIVDLLCERLGELTPLRPEFCAAPTPPPAPPPPPPPAPEPPPPPPPPPPFPADMLFISEVAWMGSVVNGATSTTAEWMELLNTGSEAMDLMNWTLASTDGTPNIGIDTDCENTIIPANGFFLLVRSTTTIMGVAADCTYTGDLENSGEDLELRNAEGTLVDNLPAATSGGWPGGDNTTKETLQRNTSETWITAVPTPGGPAPMP